MSHWQSTIGCTLLSLTLIGCSPGAHDSSLGGATDTDPRFVGPRPSTKVLAAVCSDAIDAAARAVMRRGVKPRFTWPSQHAGGKVRCYTDRASTITTDPTGVRVEAWVEFRPHLDTQREAALPPGERQNRCAAVEGSGEEQMTIAGQLLCTKTHQVGDRRRERRSGYISRATVVTVSTTGFTYLGKDDTNASDIARFTDRIHEVLVTAVVKGFADTSPDAQPRTRATAWNTTDMSPNNYVRIPAHRSRPDRPRVGSIEGV